MYIYIHIHIYIYISLPTRPTVPLQWSDAIGSAGIDFKEALLWVRISGPPCQIALSLSDQATGLATPEPIQLYLSGPPYSLRATPPPAPDREDASSMVTAGATANTTVKNSRASRESGLLSSHSHGESIAPQPSEGQGQASHEAQSVPLGAVAVAGSLFGRVNPGQASHEAQSIPSGAVAVAGSLFGPVRVTREGQGQASHEAPSVPSGAVAVAGSLFGPVRVELVDANGVAITCVPFAPELRHIEPESKSGAASKTGAGSKSGAASKSGAGSPSGVGVPTRSFSRVGGSCRGSVERLEWLCDPHTGAQEAAELTFKLEGAAGRHKIWLHDASGLVSQPIPLTVEVLPARTSAACCELTPRSFYCAPLIAGELRQLKLCCRDAYGNAALEGRDQVELKLEPAGHDETQK